MSAGQRLGQKLRGKYGRTLLMGTVASTGGLESRSMIEVELDDGSAVNAFAWTQADIRPGDDVVLGHLDDSDHPVYTIVAVNAPPIGLDPLSRDPKPEVVLWSGDPFRPPYMVKGAGNGTYMAIGRAQAAAQLNFQTYTRMRVDLRFHHAPDLSKVRYWLFGYDVGQALPPGQTGVGTALAPTANFPTFKLEIGTSWTSVSQRRLRTIFDMEAPGYLGDWLDDRLEARFVLGVEQVSGGTVRATSLGMIEQVIVTFEGVVTADPFLLKAESELTLTVPDPDWVNLRAGSAMTIRRLWLEAAGYLDAEPIVLGAIDPSL